MCGIAGVRKFGKEPITGEEIVLLLCSLERRGPHATGIALMDSKGIKIHKAPQPAWQYTKSKEFKEFLEANLSPDTYVALLHTRFATVGNPNDNKNNHPMYDGTNAIVHNGGIRNADWLFKENKFTKSCETDSDIVRAMVDAHGLTPKAVKEMCRMAGSGAIACISEKQPGTLLLARSGNPLIYGFDRDTDKLYWASELQAINKASRPWYQIRNIWVQDAKSHLAIGSIPDNTAWILNDQKLDAHCQFNVCTHFTPPDYSQSRGNYHGKMSAFKRAAREETKKEEKKEDTSKKNERRSTRNAGEDVRFGLPEQNAIAVCGACGTSVRNSQGLAWGLVTCPTCHQPMISE